MRVLFLVLIAIIAGCSPAPETEVLAAEETAIITEDAAVIVDDTIVATPEGIVDVEDVAVITPDETVVAETVKPVLPEGRNFDQWLASRRKSLEKAGKACDPAFEARLFKNYDLNGDGVVTAEENIAAKKKKK